MRISVPGDRCVAHGPRAGLAAHGLARHGCGLGPTGLLLTAHRLTRHALGALARLTRRTHWALRTPGSPRLPTERGALGPSLGTTLAARHTLRISIPGNRRLAHRARAGLAAHGLTRHGRGLVTPLGSRRLTRYRALVPGLARLTRHARRTGLLALGRLPHGSARRGPASGPLHHRNRVLRRSLAIGRAGCGLGAEGGCLNPVLLGSRLTAHGALLPADGRRLEPGVAGLGWLGALSALLCGWRSPAFGRGAAHGGLGARRLGGGGGLGGFGLSGILAAHDGRQVKRLHLRRLIPGMAATRAFQRAAFLSQ